MSTPGGSMWANLHLLDRQILDRDGKPVAKVDDLEIDLSTEPDAESLPTVTALLCGPAALGRRFGRAAGDFFDALRALLRDKPSPRPAAIPYEDVAEFGPAIKLSVTKESLAMAVVENFLGEHVIAHIPGSGEPERDVNGSGSA